jgi:hypothetical protein
LPPGNVPTPRNPLIGRAQELQTARDWLLRADVRERSTRAGTTGGGAGHGSARWVTPALLRAGRHCM